MKTSRELRIASLGDIHLNSKSTDTKNILEGLRAAFPHNAETDALDLICLNGDIFDSLMHMSDPLVFEIELWIVEFLRMCKLRNIVLRVLEGTPSHDRGQSRQFAVLNEACKIGADCRYVDNLEIEWISALGISMLYIPDEWRHDHDDIWAEVQNCLSENSLKQVDFIMMHGAFKYQYLEHLNLPAHEPRRYLAITKYQIFIGHLHKTSVYKTILAAGSFDRLCHNEEGPKGHFRLVVNLEDPTATTVTFVENHCATIYRTLDLTGVGLKVALTKIHQAIEEIQSGHIRIRAFREDEISAHLPELIKAHPSIHWKQQLTTTATASKVQLERYQVVELTATNLPDLVATQLTAQQHSPADVSRIMEKLALVIGG